MSAAERLAALFVTPVGEASSALAVGERDAGSAVRRGPPAGSGLTTRGDGQDGRARVERPRAAPVSPLDAPGPSVCVLGGDRAATRFAWALAARLSRLPGARCAVLCAAPLAGGAAQTWPPGLPGPPAPAASRVARGLVADGHEASVRGRVVELALPDAPEAVDAALAAVRGRAGDAPTLTLLRGARRSPLGAVIARQHLVLVVVVDDASPSLSAVAVAELTRVAPGAVVRAVPLPGRLGGAARRAAVTRALEALR